ncbi:hypothetical protein O4H49_04135 [Kiloniella laminariae]|uniref:Uncharacterized protein n=1 Tax=Kiloniella laminariae TaxID=454162 RepID=A0ABT4LFT8_9PROT|nr:hypothetical protein [Kiloniella laminariae]MCZ4279954.1 hypothetical protein [Kiloniella laminariae]
MKDILLSGSKRISNSLITIVTLVCSFSLLAHSQEEGDNRNKYIDTEYYILESLYQENIRRKDDSAYAKFVKAIYRVVNSTGLPPTMISIPGRILVQSSGSLVDNYAGGVLPLIHFGQLEGKKHIFLNITQAQLLARAWYLKHPESSHEVLSTYAIKSEDFLKIVKDYEGLLQSGSVPNSARIQELHNKIPKPLMFLAKLFDFPKGQGALPANAMAGYRISRCIEDTLPFLEKLVKMNFEIFGLVPSGSNDISLIAESDLIPLTPECL